MDDKKTSSAVGRAAEEAARAYLRKKGLRILRRNYRNRRGEVDIIAEDDNELIFIEVRRRKSADDAAESITAAKRQKLLAAAKVYLAAHGGDCACRFDAVLVDDNGKIHWLKNAFGDGC